MKTQFIRSGVMLMLFAVTPMVAQASGQLALRVVVNRATCDISLPGGAMQIFEPFSPEDFNRSLVAAQGRAPVVLSLGGAGCRKVPLALNNRVALVVSGPVASGSLGEVWGNRYEEQWWGVRLRYQPEGRFGLRMLTPDDNRLETARTPPPRFGDDRELLVFQPEIYTWNARQVRAGHGMVVPLIFSVPYE
ncbi:hypothetical protein [Citrobacter koseri]|uniref:hypothetical protein n=1 Tax=Citrobacter koseri TaxID=545 RepID=UPI000E04B205|nr:hypothetical protein [Citrobacter koseri]STB73308.1 Uncharacterised protein [Citrobacter koseri]STT23487.1 Uncharacterised protein [Citrobacter koseri]